MLEYVADSNESHNEVYDIRSKNIMPLTHPNRLSQALNFSYFIMRLKTNQSACELAKKVTNRKTCAYNHYIGL